MSARAPQGPAQARLLTALGLQPHADGPVLSGWGAWLDLLAADGVDLQGLEIARSASEAAIAMAAWGPVDDLDRGVAEVLDDLRDDGADLGILDALRARLHGASASRGEALGAWRVRDADGPRHGWALRGVLGTELLADLWPGDLPEGAEHARAVWVVLDGAAAGRVGVRVSLDDRAPAVAWIDHFSTPDAGHDAEVVTELLAHTTAADALAERHADGRPARAGLRLHLAGPAGRTAALVAAGIAEELDAPLAAFEGALDAGPPDAVDLWGDPDDGVTGAVLRYRSPR